jgi:hypothetical protein
LQGAIYRAAIPEMRRVFLEGGRPGRRGARGRAPSRKTSQKVTEVAARLCHFQPMTS